MYYAKVNSNRPAPRSNQHCKQDIPTIDCVFHWLGSKIFSQSGNLIVTLCTSHLRLSLVLYIHHRFSKIGNKALIHTGWRHMWRHIRWTYCNRMKRNKRKDRNYNELEPFVDLHVCRIYPTFSRTELSATSLEQLWSRGLNIESALCWRDRLRTENGS